MDLDSMETTLCIPYRGPEEPEADGNLNVELVALEEVAHRDLADGPKLRLEAYKATWNRCLERMQNIIYELHAPLVNDVVQAVRDAYRVREPLLPFTELPTILISASDRAAASTLFESICLDLTGEGQDDHDSAMSEDASDVREPIAFVVSMSSAECTNIVSASKTLITGFIEIPPDDTEVQIKRKPSTSLAAYDMNLLKAWYNAVRSHRGEKDAPHLVVLLQDFEQFDPAVVKDLFYICSLHIPYLPLVFILALSSPSHPSYIHTMYPRSTLSLLRLQQFTMIGGSKALERLFLKTFFDQEFEPGIMPSPEAIDFILEQFMRYNMSLDFVISLLQLIHMHHFMEPLTVFVIDELLGTKSLSEAASKLQDSSSLPFLDALLTRLHHPEKNNAPDNEDSSSNLKWKATDVQTLLSEIRSVRTFNSTQARKSRLAFALFRLVQGFLLEQGYKTADSGRTLFETMSACLRGTLSRKEGRYLAVMVKKLAGAKLSALLTEMHKFFHDQSTNIRTEEEQARLKIVTWMSQLPRDDVEVTSVVHIANEVGDWLVEYFSVCMTGFMNANLWDLWYTGPASMLSELLNPAPREAIVTGLIHPERYLQYSAGASNDKLHPQQSAQPLPDISILFQGYLESGRMINVYDWFQSFAVALDGNEHGPTGTSANDKKGKRKAEPSPIRTDRDEEGWMREVQARFIRSIHELDYLGFIKHTGRKPDHVVKTVFDLPDS